MAVTQVDCAGAGGHEYICLSGDNKPTVGVAENALLLEADTGDFYYYSNKSWSKVGGNSESV